MKKIAFMFIAAMALSFVACDEKKEENKDAQTEQKADQPAEGQQAQQGDAQK